ncbi:unnamed protein product [Protopolystoma xenopodis]|uniref:Uncharacterized protein n=1 Tax=Protopolystoma xenopodis TaxID=117903 RepID=A0A3S5B862_9PLAT|nr:unnamed protein product [Protopolystoma xenopodis]
MYAPKRFAAPSPPPRHHHRSFSPQLPLFLFLLASSAPDHSFARHNLSREITLHDNDCLVLVRQNLPSFPGVTRIFQLRHRQGGGSFRQPAPPAPQPGPARFCSPQNMQPNSPVALNPVALTPQLLEVVWLVDGSLVPVDGSRAVHSIEQLFSPDWPSERLNAVKIGSLAGAVGGPPNIFLDKVSRHHSPSGQVHYLFFSVIPPFTHSIINFKFY